MTFNEFIHSYKKVPVRCFNTFKEIRPLVSVCVITYNHENFIRKCLEGILMQKTSFHYEILLGEDASTDGTRAICIEYAQRYPDIIRLFLHKRENNISINGSPTGRFNFMYNLCNSRGKYIALCEGDDYWTDTNKLQSQFDFMESNEEYSMCYHGCYKLIDGVLTDPSSVGEAEVTYKQLLENHPNPLIHTLSIFYRFNEKVLAYYLNHAKKLLTGDIPLILLLSLNGKIYRKSQIMGVYRVHSGGITNVWKNDRYRIYKSRIPICEMLINYIILSEKKGSFLELTKDFLDKKYYSYGRELIRNQEYYRGIINLMKGYKYIYKKTIEGIIN